MPACRACSVEIATGARFCPSCGARTEQGSGAASPVSVLETRDAAARRDDRPPSDVSHGRFLPGTVLGQRYRVVGLLGKGGMGEVYRADDLKLGQAVALKFLPHQFAGNPARLARLLDEVRVARQISHPNVCRVYDADEADGEHFLSMEYVHGEDLATLLHRIGRLPADKALQVARQLCAGLAAAHDKGMVHRDLKPANILLDERGVARVSDFGLTAPVTQLDAGNAREGTPAYMAPELLAGGTASVRSDVYAVGLVLYELFTGRRPFEADTLAELRRLRQEQTPQEPSRLVENLDPAVERVILRCLERDPSDRPPSALAVSAALPGGDPLAAALAAGETPSPELVAAAGGAAGIDPRLGALCVAGVAAAALVSAWLGAQASLVSRVPLPHSPEVLAAKARELLARLGFDEAPEATASGFRHDDDYARHVETSDQSMERWRGAAAERPPLLRFWYRESPRPLEAEGFFGPVSGGGKVTLSDPPSLVSRMKTVELDPQGRLVSLSVVPPQVDEARKATGALDWAPLFTAAGLDEGRFHPVAPTWNPPSAADARAAWEGSYAERPDLKLRVEAAAYAGRPVWFEILGPWSRPARMQEVRLTRGEKAAQAVGIATLCAIGAGALFVARRNLRSGRGDRRGALRVASFVLACTQIEWLVGADHVWTAYEFVLLVMAVSWGLFIGAMVWVLYVAVEPYVRRRWPQMLISWTRLLAGRPGDPLVGRDVLLGLLAGGAVSVLGRLRPLAEALAGAPPPEPDLSPLLALAGARYALVTLLAQAMGAVFSGLAVLFALLLLRALLRREWLANAALVATFSVGSFLAAPSLVPGLLSVGIWVVLLLALRRAGLTAACCAFFSANALLNGPASGALSAWHTWPLLLNLLALAALAAFAFSRATAGRPLFREGLFEA
jgi:serine/threonine-protein kinase